MTGELVSWVEYKLARGNDRGVLPQVMPPNTDYE